MKNILREKYLELRKAISSEENADKSIEIANNLLQLPIWNKEYYHLFLNIEQKNEIDTQPILHIIQGKDKNIVLAKSDLQTCDMQHFLLTDTTVIKPNKWNIPEPQAGIPVPENLIDVVFVPLLAYDRKGNRVGYGKGFYDKFLAKCSPETLKIGLSYFEPEEEISGITSSDIPLDYVVTPAKIYEFNK